MSETIEPGVPIERANANRGACQPIENCDELIAEICDRLGEGELLREICELPGMPSTNSFHRWIMDDPPAWGRYMQAREIQAHSYAARAMDEALGATDAAIGKLQLDALKWAAGKLAPRFYGKSQQLKLADADGGKLDTAPLVGELLTMLGSGGAPAEQPTILNVTPRRIEQGATSELPAAPAVRAFDNPGYRPRAKRLPPAINSGVDDLV